MALLRMKKFRFSIRASASEVSNFVGGSPVNRIIINAPRPYISSLTVGISIDCCSGDMKPGVPSSKGGIGMPLVVGKPTLSQLGITDPLYQLESSLAPYRGVHILF